MTVALTGATGFLGLHLVRELLADHDSLLVLARGEPPTVRDRIVAFFTAAGVPPPRDLPERLQVVQVDVTMPRLGLTEAAFEELADRVSELWHSAADTTQDGDLRRLRGTNVEGTRNVLELVRPGTRFFHVSTAFVAGRRRYGTVYDDELTDEHGFETPYERSKYEAELEVRAWAAAHGRPAMVFRPSVLATHLPPGPHVPSHPLLFAARSLRAVADGTPDSADAVVRVPGHPDSHLNVMPVEDAAAVMVALAGKVDSPGVETFHVAHPEELPVSALFAALAETLPYRFVIRPEAPDPTPLEARVRLLSGALTYSHHRRRYDDARVRSLVDVRPSRGRLDRAYLLAGIRP